jgi:hypothetical protein
MDESGRKGNGGEEEIYGVVYIYTLHSCDTRVVLYTPRRYDNLTTDDRLTHPEPLPFQGI